jgi:hypothetical protein
MFHIISDNILTLFGLASFLAKNGVFILASVWAYQICWLNNYRKKKNPADVKEQIENARFRLKL